MPPEVVFIVFTAICAVTLWVALGLKYRAKGRTGNPDALDALEKRLARLEVAIDDMTTELTRMTEGQQFLTKALSERSSPERVPLPRG